MRNRFSKGINNYIVNENGCWIWQGTKRGGYGMIHNPRYTRNTVGISKMLQAHRVMYELVKGPIPAGLFLDHIKELCSRRDCINPDHCEPVDNQENVRRGRVCVMTLERANSLRLDYQKYSQETLAEMYGISQSTVSQILTGKTWM